MFDLEQAIKKWRQQMADGGIKNPAVLDELESHLREEIDRQMRAGGDTERAFDLAAKKMGPANTLRTEFRKNGFASALEKFMIAVATLFVAFIIFLTTVTMVLCYSSLGQRLEGFAALVFILAAALGWPRLAPCLPVIRRKSKRLAIEAACFLAGFGLCTFYVQVIVRQFERAGEAIPAMGFWGIFPIAVGFGIGCALEQAAQRASTQTVA